jgi:hypothetical protein
MPTRGRLAAEDRGEDGRPAPRGERGRGLFLVAALSARWDWYLTKEPRGKVVWCEIEALSVPVRVAIASARACRIPEFAFRY